MMPLFSSALSGIQAAVTRHNVTANNVANMSTTGFKKSRVILESSLFDNGVSIESILRVNTQGSLMSTNWATDIAIDGKGYFQVALDENTIAYTRDGTFRVDNAGMVVTYDGKPILPGTFIPATTDIVIMETNGTVRGLIEGEWQDLQRLELADFSSFEGLTPAGNNLYLESAESGAPIIGYPGEGGFGTIVQGSLEMSNVDFAEEAVNDIMTQTLFGANIASIRAGDRMLGTLMDIIV